MPWLVEAMKDVPGCDKSRGAVKGITLVAASERVRGQTVSLLTGL